MSILQIARVPSLLTLSNLTQTRVCSHDEWNNIADSEFTVNFFHKETDIGYIRYRAGVGQIGQFYLEKSYRGRGLGKQILQQTIRHMHEFNQTHVWAVTSHNHPFWSNVFNKSFQWRESGQLHPSVSGYGYIAAITSSSFLH